MKKKIRFYIVWSAVVLILIMVVSVTSKIEHRVMEQTEEIASTEDKETYVAVGMTEEGRLEEEKKVMTLADKYNKEYRIVYPKAGVEGTMKYFAALGFSVCDIAYQYNMKNELDMDSFCRDLENGKTADLTVISIPSDGGFGMSEFHSEDKKLTVTESSVIYKDEKPEISWMRSFEAINYKYTEKGWFFYQDYRPDGYDGDNGYEAIRVKPQEEELRQLGEKYIANIGYRYNNFFLTDWSTQDYSDLEFEDLYQVFYESEYGYDMDIDLYENGINKDEFQTIIMQYLDIDEETLQSLCHYDETTQKYNWYHRLIDEANGCYFIDPEVVDETKNEDGTITLTVDAIWPEEMTDQAFTHKVTIREEEDGSFKYLSNEIVLREQNIMPEYTKRGWADETQ